MRLQILDLAKDDLIDGFHFYEAKEGVPSALEPWTKVTMASLSFRLALAHRQAAELALALLS